MSTFGLPPPRQEGSPFFKPIKPVNSAISSETIKVERRSAYLAGWEAGYNAGRQITDIGITYGEDNPMKIIGSDRITMSRICEEVAIKHGVSVAEMKGARRHHAVVVARHEFFWRACQETGNTLPHIGRFLGNKDHTTVINGCKRHTERLAEESENDG